MNAADGASFWRLQVFRSLTSTSDLCVTLAAAGEPEGLAVLALQQTHGRGSRGRDWTSPLGNLNLSVLLRPRCKATEAGNWALLAGVALVEALQPMLPSDGKLKLKWPNDVLLGGGKLAGVLIDVGSADGHLSWMVIGLGVNLLEAPDIQGRRTASLADAGVMPPEPEQFAPILLERLQAWRQRWLLEGFAPVRAAWLALAQPVGTRLRLARGDQVLGGRFVGLADDGALLLQANGRVHAFSTGDVLLQDEPSQAGG